MFYLPLRNTDNGRKLIDFVYRSMYLCVVMQTENIAGRPVKDRLDFGLTASDLSRLKRFGLDFVLRSYKKSRKIDEILRNWYWFPKQICVLRRL